MSEVLDWAKPSVPELCKCGLDPGSWMVRQALLLPLVD